MVRETRYLLIGNLPENTTEDEVTDYFKRYGKIQKVIINGTKGEQKDDKEDKSTTATVAFTDIKSASNAHKAEKKIGNNLITSEYSEGFATTGSVVTRTHEPEIYPRPPPTSYPNRQKGFEEEVDGFDIYYGTTPQYNEGPYPTPPAPFSEENRPQNFPNRGRPRERTWIPGVNFHGRGAKWTGGTMRIYSDSVSKDVTPIPAASPTHSVAQSTSSKCSKKKKRKSSKSVSRSGSRSSSTSSRSSSSGSSRSASSSTERPKTVASTAQKVSQEPPIENEIEPGEREPLGIYITKLPIRSSDTSLRDGLFHEYKKYGKVTAVQVCGVADGRYAIVSFKQGEDAAKALTASQGKRFFGTQIEVVQHEGIEVDDTDLKPPEAELDEHHPKATRTLFIGNLEKDITIDELKEKLKTYGEIIDVDVKRQGAVSAYAFIQFSDISSVVRALRDLEGTAFGANKIKLGFGKSMATSCIWLDNLADTVSEGFLCRQFSRFGGISHAVVDRAKRRGLVFFLNIESAQFALPEMRNRIWNGKKIHIDFASRDCQESFFQKMEASGQLQPGERPDPRWMNKQLQNDPHWDESMEKDFPANPPHSNALNRRGGFQQFRRGRGRFQRGWGAFRGRGGPFEHGSFNSEEFPGRRKQFDEYSQGSGQYPEDDSYEQELREYGHSQRERRERSTSPHGYDDAYYETGSQTGRDYDLYEKHRYEHYRSPSSERELDLEEEYKYKSRTSDERYYYKDKYYENETKSRERSLSSDSEQRYRVASEIVRTNSRSRSPSLKHKRTKELPISYRSQSPPTPTDDEPLYYSNSRDPSPTDFDSAFRKYGDYKKRLSGGLESDKGSKSSVLTLATGLRKEIESVKAEDKLSRKRSYDQMSPKKMERQHSRGSRSGYDYDRSEKLTAKELLIKVARLKSEVYERTTGKSSPSSGSSYGDIDPSTLSEAELAKLHHEKQKLLDKLTQIDENGSTSDTESNGDMRHVINKKARLEQGHGKYYQKSESLNLSKHELKEKLKLLDSTQSCRKQMESLRKKEQEKELLRNLKKTKSAGDVKRDLFDYSDTEENLGLNSPKEIPSGFLPKKRRKLEGDSDRKSRSYRVRRDDEEGAYSSEEDKSDLLQRQISSHSDLFERTRSLSGGMDIRLENESIYSSSNVHSHGKDETRRISSGSESNKEHSEHRRRKKQKNNHVTPLIPLGEDDEMPDPEVSDPRVPREKRDSPLILPLPKFAQYIHFSPPPSPVHSSPKTFTDLSKTERTPPRQSESQTLPETAPLPMPPLATDTEYQSPCFSPQSSSSKTHSPSQSPSGSASDNSKGNSEENVESFPSNEITPDPVLEENKPDSLDSVSNLEKDLETKDEGNLSDSNSDPENLSCDNLSIEERIRQLDEKWSKAQQAVTPKTIPEVESVVNYSVPSNNMSLLTSVTTTASSSPSLTSIYSKFKIRKKNESTADGGDKGEPSEIVRTVLSKTSIFDQDSKRLEQIYDKYDGKESNCIADESSPKLLSVRTKAAAKEMPMSTLPGSLMERLGQNTSFPTLTVNTSLANQMPGGSPNSLVNKSFESSIELNIPENITPKTSPRINLITNSATLTPPMNPVISLEGSATPKSNHSYSESDSQPPVLETSVKSVSSVRPYKTVESEIADTENLAKAPELERQGDEKLSKKSDVLFKRDTSENNEAVSTCANGDLSNATDIQRTLNTSDETETFTDTGNSIPGTPKKEEKTETLDNVNLLAEKVETKIEKCAADPNNVKEISSTNKSEIFNVCVKKESIKKEKKDSDGNNIKDLSSRSAFDVDIFGMSTPLVIGKRKAEDLKSDTDSKSDIKSDVESKSETKVDPAVELKSEIKQETDAKQKEKGSDLDKMSQKQKSSSDKDKSKSEKDKVKEKSHSNMEPNSKKQKTSKDKKSDSSQKDDKHKKKDNEKKSDSHKSSSDKKDKHKAKSDKDKKDSDKKSKDDKDKKEKDEKKKKDSEKKEQKDEKKDKHETDKKDKQEGEKKDRPDDKKDRTDDHKKSEKVKSSSSNKDKKDKKDSHKHDKHTDKHGLKSPDKKSSKSSSTENKEKDSSKESDKPEKDTKNEKKSEHSHKKEHKSSGSHKTKKSKEETSDMNKPKDSKESVAESKSKLEHSVDINKDAIEESKEAAEKKDQPEEKSKEKEKESTGEKCKDSKSQDKERENKDRDPDAPKSKGKSASSSSDKSKTASENKTQKSKSEKPVSEEKKSDSKKEDRKNKDSSSKSGGGLSSNSSKSSSKDKDKDKIKSDSQSKSSTKSEKSSSKSSSKSNADSSSKKEDKTTKDSNKDNSKDKENKESKDKETPKKKPEHKEHRLTELEKLDVNLASFYIEPYVSMYDKVKRRSTDKKDKEKESEELRKQINAYKKKKKKKKFSLSDVTESSEISTDEDTKKKRENKKKFGLSFVDTDSSSDDEILRNPKKTIKGQTKKPKRILDIYSSDSEEEESVKSPAKKSSSKSKKPDHFNFDFDSLSDSDHKNSSTKPAKSKTTPKAKKSDKSNKSNSKPAAKKGNKPKLPRKDLSLKDLFSDDSDDSHFSDSDSDSDIMIKPKLKKKPDPKMPQNKKALPKGSSIYTTSEDSESETERKPILSPVKKSPAKKTFDKKGESDTFTSDPEFFDKDKTKKKGKSNTKLDKKHSDSFESDSFFSDPEFTKPKNKTKDTTQLDGVQAETKDSVVLSAPETEVKLEKSKDKIKKQKSKDKASKESKKSKKNKKNADILSDSEKNLSKNMSKLDVTEVYSETVFEKDEPSESLKKSDQMPVLSIAKEEPITNHESSSLEKDLVKLAIDDNHKVPKVEKVKSKKHKKEKKKKKDKEREKTGSASNLPDLISDVDEHVNDSKTDAISHSQEIKAETEVVSDANTSGNSTRNLFEELRADMSSDEKEVKKHKKKKEKVETKVEEKINLEVKSDLMLDEPVTTEEESCNRPDNENADIKPEKQRDDRKEAGLTASQTLKETVEPSNTIEAEEKTVQGNDVFEFTEEEETEKSLTPFKESHVKIMKPTAFPELKLNREEDKDVDTNEIPIEIEGVEIEYQIQEQDYKDESEDVCPEVETSEVVIETNVEEKALPNKPKQKAKRRRGRRNSAKETNSELANVDSNIFGVSCDKGDASKADLTLEAVSSLENSQKAVEELQTEVVSFDPPTSNEHELIIDEGVSLQVQDETASAVESIVESRNDVDETAKAVESILLGNEIPGFGLSDPSQPTPQQLEEAYLGNLNQPEPIPQLQTVEVEATTQPDKTSQSKAKGKRRGRRSKSGQNEISHESELLIMETIESVSHGDDLNEEKQIENSENKSSHDTTTLNPYLADVTNQHNQNDDDDDVGRLQIVLDPPKPEPQRKPRKQKQIKGRKMADAAALAAENKMDNIFDSHSSLQYPSDTDTENKEVSDLNRDSVSENELDNSKNEDLLFMDREDQRHDSDLLSPDERSNEDTAAADIVKRPKRGRKPKNYKEMNSGQKASSPRGTRTVSPRSPRSNDPRSPKYEAPSPLVKTNENKGRRGKGLLEDGDMKEILNEETGEIKLSSIENIKNKLTFSEGNKNFQKLTNVFDFDDEETTTVKQQRQRKKKGDLLQSPENRSIFSSPEHNQMISSEDKLCIGSPQAKMPFNSPEHKISFNSPDKKSFDLEKKLEIDLKAGLFSPLGPVENQKAEVKAVVEEKDPEPLFKAFFEAKSKSGKQENDKIPPVVISRRPSASQIDLKDLKVDISKQDTKHDVEKAKGLMSPPDKTKALMSPPASAQSMSNVDKTIDNVSKGLFEGSTDDEAGTPAGETGSSTGQRKRASRKSRDEKKEQTLMNSIPAGSQPGLPSVTTPVVVTAPIGEPPVVGHVGLPSSPLSSPLPVPATQPAVTASTQILSADDKTATPEINLPSQQQTPPSSGQQPQSLLSPSKTAVPVATEAAAVTTSGPTTTLASAVTTKPEPPKVEVSTEDVLKNAMPSFLVPGISGSSALNVVQKVSSVSGTGPLASVSSVAPGKVESNAPPNAAEVQKMQQELLEKQRMEQKILQKQQSQELMLKRQQEVQIRLQEQEHQKQLLQKLQEKHKQLQEQQKLQEKEKEQQQEAARQKQLEEHHKQLQQQFEQLQRQQGLPVQPGGPGNKGAPPPMLSPGAIRPQRPSLPSPGANAGPRPPISAHHQMPPGAPFGLPGQHPGALPIHAAHLNPGQLPLPQHLIPPSLGQEKQPTSAAQQMQQQLLSQAQKAQQAQLQKVQAQYIAEQQAQIAKQQAQQAQAQMKAQAQQNQAHAQTGKQGPATPAQPGPGPAGPPTPGKKVQESSAPKSGQQAGRKEATPQRPPSGHAPGPPPPQGKEGPRPGSQEAANQLQQQIRQQLAMSQNHPGGHPPGHPQHPVHGWPMHSGRPEGQPKDEPRPATSEARTSMPGPVPVIGGNPQSVQRVSPHPPTKSPTVAQTAPNMVLGVTPHQASAPRAPSPAVAKTAERPPNGKWSSTSPGAQRPGQSDIRPRVPHSEPSPVSSRPEMWGLHGPPGQPPQGMNITPRPAHQQPPSAHQQQPDHPLPLQRPPAPEQMGAKDKFMQQQREKQLQELQLLHQQELQRQELRQQQLRDQALHSQAQKEVQKERERAQELERDGRVSQSPSDPRQSPAGVLPHRIGYPPFVEPRPPSREGKMQQSPAIMDPRFSQYPPGHHPADLRINSSQAPSAFSPAAPGSTDTPHMYSPAEIQRLQQNGIIPAYPGGLRILEPHMVPGHAPYMLPGSVHPLAYITQQMDHQHLVDGRPQSRECGRPPSTSSAHNVSPTLAAPPDSRLPTRGQNGPQTRPGSDGPHPGDGSLLSLLQRYPVMWQGILGLKNDNCVVQMHFIAGCRPLVKLSLPQQGPDGTVQPLRIAQRMRLEQAQLDGVAKRMQFEKDYCMMLALPCGRDHTDIYQQTRAMSTGFIQYLQAKQAAGIVNVADPGSQQPAYVVHIFPPCEFSNSTLSRLGFDLLYQVKDLAHLIVIIATVA